MSCLYLISQVINNICVVDVKILRLSRDRSLITPLVVVLLLRLYFLLTTIVQFAVVRFV